MRENRQMTNKKLYCEDVLQMLFTESDSEGEYLHFGNDDRPSNDGVSPSTSLLRDGAAGCNPPDTGPHQLTERVANPGLRRGRRAL